MQVLLLTPDGRVLHATSGYVPPKEFHWELGQALVTWRAVQKAQRSDPKAEVARRQDEIQKAYKKRGDRPKHKWSLTRADQDRDFVRKHPLLSVGTFRTRMLTGGPGGRFGYGVGDDAGESPGLVGRGGKPGHKPPARGGGGGFLGRTGGRLR